MFDRQDIELSHPNHLVGNSESMIRLYDLIETVAPTDAPVMIVGETGTGKELTAREIHRQSLRKNHPFVAINCPAVVDSLWQSEIFGHEKGAFTGAIAMKKGRFELANKGTFFLTKCLKCPFHCRPNSSGSLRKGYLKGSAAQDRSISTFV